MCSDIRRLCDDISKKDFFSFHECCACCNQDFIKRASRKTDYS